MKNKSLVIISFAFIFLLNVSIVSAGFFDWITGDVQRSTGTRSIAAGIDGIPACNPVCKPRETCVDGQCQPDISVNVYKDEPIKTSSRFGAAGDCPRGWNIISAKEGGNCCKKKEVTSNRLFGRR